MGGRHMKRRRLVIGLDGGLVQWVCSDLTDVDIIVMDLDVEGADKTELYAGIAHIHREEIYPLTSLERKEAKALKEYDKACYTEQHQQRISTE